jgi:hypothetical protein
MFAIAVSSDAIARAVKMAAAAHLRRSPDRSSIVTGPFAVIVSVDILAFQKGNETHDDDRSCVNA